MIIIVRWSSLTETRSVVAKTTRDTTFPEQIDERQKEPTQYFPQGHDRHKDNIFGWVGFFFFRVFLCVRRLLDAHTTSQTAETPTRDGC